MGSWLLSSTPDGEAWVRALAEDIVLRSWARHLTFTVSLSTQVLDVKMGTGKFNTGGNLAHAMD